MRYDFDNVPNRLETDSYKWDCNKKEFPTRPDAIPMWVADMDFPCPNEIVEAVQERAKHPIYGYSTIPEEVSDAIVKWQKRRNNWEIEPSWITYTNGVVPAISMAVRAFAKEQEGVVIMTPVYYPFKISVESNGRKLCDCPMKFDGEKWNIDFEVFERMVEDPNTKLLILCNPHNPLCRVFRREELQRVADICKKNDVVIFSDEIHSDLIFEGNKHIPIASISSDIADISLTATAPSKTFNIAGLQMSAIICKNERYREQFNSALGFEFIPSVFGVAGIKAAYSQPGCEEYLGQLVKYIWGNYELLKKELEKKIPSITVLKPQATYLMWLDCRKLHMTNEELYHFFVTEAGVGIEMGTLFGDKSEGFVRMNIGCTRATIEECVRRLESAYKKY